MTTCLHILAATTAISFTLVPSGCGRQGEKSRVQREEHGAPVRKAAAEASIEDASPPAPPPRHAAACARAFDPPFPHRHNPFLQPDSAALQVASQLRRSEGEGSIQLKGFVTVDRLKALLKIDGRVWAAEEGETRDGVAVLRIAPPAVTLQREGQQWDLSLRKDG